MNVGVRFTTSSTLEVVMRTIPGTSDSPRVMKSSSSWFDRKTAAARMS